MTVGRKPIPAEMQRQLGDPSHRPPKSAKLVGGRITEEEAATLVVPPHFTPDHEHAWREIIEPLVRGGVLDWADLPLVELAADALVRSRWSRSQVQSARDLSQLGKHLEATSPFPAISTAASAEFRQLATILGLGPANRARYSKGAPGAKPDGGLEGEMGRVLPLRRLKAVGEDSE